MTRPAPLIFLVAFAILIFVLMTGTALVIRLYYAGRISTYGVEVGWIIIATVPGLIAWAGIFIAGLRSGYWAWIMLPGVLVWASRPWVYIKGAGGTEFLGAWYYLEGYARMAWTATKDGTALEPAAIAGIAGTLIVMTLSALMTGQSIRQTKKHIRNAGRNTANRQQGGGLPQATWATDREVRDRFSHPGGIVLGEMTDPVRDTPKFSPSNTRTWRRKQGRGRLISMSPTDGNGHVLVTSQASGYKSTGIVIPNILNYNGPLVVFDPKCELYARTADARRKMGFNPIVIDGNNGYDPAKLIALLARNHPSAYLRMARMMIPREYGGVENGKFFKDAATALFTGLLGYFAETGSQNIVGDIAEVLSLPAGKVHDYVAENLANSRHEFVINRLNDLEDMESRFYHSIKTEITNNLLFAEFSDIQRYATMPPDSPLLTQLLDPRTDIFLNIPQHVAEDFAPMLRLMLGSFLVAAQLTEVNEAPRARRLFIIDEAAKLGNMDILENIRDRGRSIGLHLMMFYQTPGEIAKLWGREGMSSWRDGCSATVMGPVSARESAEALSAMLGSRTVRITTEGSSSQHQVMSPMGGSVGSSENEQLRDVPLISPVLISQLPRHASVITAPASKPILASKAIWFTRPDMADRVRSTQDIAASLEVARNQRQLIEHLKEYKASLTEGESSTAPAVPETDDGGKSDTDGDDDSPPAPAARQDRTTWTGETAGTIVRIADDKTDEPPAREADSPDIAQDIPEVAGETGDKTSGDGEDGPEQMALHLEAEPENGSESGGNGDESAEPDNGGDDKGGSDHNDDDPDGGPDGGSGTPPPADPQTQSEPPVASPSADTPQNNREHLPRAMCGDPDVHVHDIPFEDLVFAWKPAHVPAFLKPLYDIWASWMIPRPGAPLNISPDTGQRIPHPREAKDGMAIIRILDRIDWSFTHPDARYELYDLKLRRRQYDGLEWRLHKLRCWIRNEPYGLPPGLRPSTDYPNHADLRAHISPATANFVPTDKRYDPVGNAVTGRWFNPRDPFCETAEWEPCDVGPIPPEHPPQLVFEHIPAVGPPDSRDHAGFTNWVTESTLEKYFVEGLLRHRKAPEPWDMAFFDAWPEIPRDRAGVFSMPLTGVNLPLNRWACCNWIDRVGGEWRLFRQAVWGENGYPLGAARTWPITGENLAWLDRPLNAAMTADMTAAS